MVFYIFHRHRVCLVDHVDLICSLYSWWEGFGSSSLATLPMRFNCGLISTSKITADGDCSLEIKRRLLLGRKAMTNVDSILKSRDVITLPTKVFLVEALVFYVWM